jgi:hypothetical protein
MVIFVWGVIAILKVLNLVTNRVLHSCRIWSTAQLNTPHLHPPTATHCIYCTVDLLWEGGRGGRSERR